MTSFALSDIEKCSTFYIHKRTIDKCYVKMCEMTLINNTTSYNSEENIRNTYFFISYCDSIKLFKPSQFQQTWLIFASEYWRISKFSSVFNKTKAFPTKSCQPQILLFSYFVIPLSVLIETTLHTFT